MFRILPWILPVLVFAGSGVILFAYEVVDHFFSCWEYDGFSIALRSFWWIVPIAFKSRIYPGEGMSLITVGPIAFVVAAMISTIWIAYLRQQDKMARKDQATSEA